MRSMSWPLLLLLAVPLAGQTQFPPREKVDLSKRGPLVGQPVPDFALRDQNGKVQTLESIMGPKGAMIVFFRSADW
jgi:hypothetical protein